MTIEVAKSFLREHPGYLRWGDGRLSEKLGLSVSLVRDLRSIIKVEQAVGIDTESTNQGGYQPPSSFQFLSSNPYEEFLAERGINPDDVVSVKHWQNMAGDPRFSVVTCDNDELTQAQMEDGIIKMLSEYSPALYVEPPQVQGERCAVVHLYDAHVDKIVLSSEVYDDDSDLTLEERFQQLEDRFDEVVAGLVHHNVEKVFFPVGNDFFTTNGPEQGTRRGTPQRTIVPHEEVFLRGVRFYLDCITKLLSVANQVEVIVIRGNHDTDAVFYLGVALQMALGREERVNVNMSRHARKYFEYGIWGFGFGHGDNEKRNMDRMPLWFAQEGKAIWYRTKFHELFLGDVHHKEVYKFRSSYDGVGMTAHFMRSTNGVDQWHSDSGWTGIPKEISATVYHRSTGRKNSVSVSW